MNIRDEIGQLFVFGFRGKCCTPELKAFMKRFNPGGIVLFSENYQSPEQLAELIAEINGIRKKYPILVTVDQEGGSVNRLSKPFTQFPGNEVLGRLEPKQEVTQQRPDGTEPPPHGKSKGESPTAGDFAEYERRVRKTVKLAYYQGEYLARELRGVGIHWNLAPVLDLRNPRSKVLKGRCFGQSPEWVSEIGLAFIAGLQDNGVIACGKHFPGHGVTAEDSHACLPEAEVPADEVGRHHIRPFARAMANGLRSVMLGHVRYPELDSKLPASLSSKITDEILRKSLHYDGIVITDDIGMQAIKGHFGIGEASCLALQAGADIVLVAEDPGDQTEAYEAVVKAAERGEIERDRLEASLRRISREKRYIQERFSSSPADGKKSIGSKEHRGLIREIKNLS